MANISAGSVTASGDAALSTLISKYANGEWVLNTNGSHYGFQIPSSAGGYFGNMNKYNEVRKDWITRLCVDGAFMQGSPIRDTFNSTVLGGHLKAYLVSVLGALLSAPANLSGNVLTAAGKLALETAIKDFWFGKATPLGSGSLGDTGVPPVADAVRGFQLGDVVNGHSLWDWQWWTVEMQDLRKRFCLDALFMQGAPLFETLGNALAADLVAYFSEPVAGGGDILGVFATT